MIEETIHSILEAEDKAAALEKQSKEDVKALLARAESEFAQKRNEQAAQSRAALQQAKAEGTEAGEALYREILAAGELQAKSLSAQGLSRKAEAVQKIVEEILR